MFKSYCLHRNRRISITRTLEKLLTTYPFLRGNKSEITLNTDKTFNEKFPDGSYYVIKIIDGKAYYTQSNGVDITPPFEIKES